MRVAINSAIAFAACLAPPPGFQRATVPVCKAKKAVIEPDSFDFDVDLGDNGGIVEHVQLEPYFSRSSLVTVRLPLPFNLDVEPVQGVYRVNIDGYGLMVGDILRAFSTIRMRYDSDLKEVRVGPGLPGKRSEAVKAADSDSNLPEWLAAFQTNFNPLTAFRENSPAKCLFVADGEPCSRVKDALVANEAGKVKEIVLVFERSEK